MALTTYVKSINGLTGNRPFQPDPKITLDSSSIKVTGSTGNTIKEKIAAIADETCYLTINQIDSDDYGININKYPFS